MKNPRYSLPLILGSLLAVPFLFPSCNPDDEAPAGAAMVSEYDAEVSLRWNEVFLQVERYAAGYRPGPAPRALAHLGLAAYEACITAMPDYNSMEGLYLGLDIPEVETGKEYHWPTVIHGVYSRMMPYFFSDVPTFALNAMASLTAELDNKYQSETTSEIFQRSKIYGESVGQAVWDWSVTDPYGHEAYKNPFGNYSTAETYDWAAHYDAPGDWEPTYPGPGMPMGPYFGKVRTFAIENEDKLSQPPSLYFMQYSENENSEYYSQALQTYTKNAEADYYTEWVGEFWSDDLLNLTFSPGPRWVAVANQVIDNDNVNLETALEAYAKVGMALNDAAVGCWFSKYHYNVERPDTYIKKIIDPNYKTNLYNPLTGEYGITPSFPAYPSGHSTMGAAGAEALASVFGYAYSLTDRCHENRTEFEGKPRPFGSFYEMAQENAWSRVLLGVHWNMDCIEGVRFGTVIGRKVNDLPWKN